MLLGAVALLPLVTLAALDGVALHGPGQASLLTDYAVWARFAVAVPLFIAVEPIADRWVTVTTQYLVGSGIVGDAARPAFANALARAERRRDSWGAELGILLLAFAIARGAVAVRLAGPAETWLRSAHGLSNAGLWYSVVSLPLFHFLLLRWLWRLVVWTLLLRRVAALDLSLVAGHPDRAGGLGVLAEVPPAFSMLAFAIGTVLAGGLANAVSTIGVSLQFLGAVAFANLAIVLLVFVTPVVGFARPLRRARRRALVHYGVLGSDLVRQFEGRWLTPGAGRDDAALQAPDFSALTDFNQLVDVVRELRFVPIDRGGLGRLAGAALIPFLPVVFMIVPIDDVLQAVAGLVL
jgi:hypothetical protein